MAEIGIRLSGVYSQLSEKNGHSFLSLFQPTHHGQFQNYMPYDTVHINNTEFSYIHAMDAYGFRNDSSYKNQDVILALGDSFTEGLGAPQDSTWPAILATQLNEPVYNAGVMGSDPVFGLKIITDNSFSFKPSKIIFALNFSDITDVVIRGGKERFTTHGVKYKPEPWFMPLYKYSHLFRAVLHMIFRYDYMFNSPQNRDEKINEALDIIEKTLLEANTVCKNRGVEMYVFIHPVPQEYYKHLDGRLNFKTMDELEGKLNAKDIHCINLRPSFEKDLKTAEDWKRVSWPIDGHFNAKGYALMAKYIAAELQKSK